MLMRNYLVSLTQHSKRFLTTLPKGASTSQGIPPPFPISQRSTVIEDLPTTSQVPWILPNEHRNVKLFSFPTLNKVALEMPMFPNIVEKVEPATDIIPINDPDSSKKTPMYANRRLIKVRKRMMKKYKKILRIRKKWTKLQKLHMEKKAKQERIFRARMAALLTELDTFDPMVYIKDTIKK
uniref:Mitochondrial mRNA-processing protein COX24 C-terminal domain-containing protein n=1 Tax=Acrobeloides nanus TaxID=290746 RepID=A0A914ENV4_9BILA